MSVYDNLDMTDREYLNRTLERVGESVAETLALLTGKDFALGEPVFEHDTVASLTTLFPDKSVVAEGAFTAGFSGRLALLVGTREAVSIAALASETDEGEIDDLIERGITAELLAQFEEIASQLFANMGVFLTRLFDTQIMLDISRLSSADLQTEPREFTERIGMDECVTVVFPFADGGAFALFIPLGVAKELSTIGLPGLPVRSPEEAAEREEEINKSNIGRLLKIRFPIVVTLAEKTENLERVLEFSEGHIIEFVKSADDPLDLLVVDKPIARGEAVKIGENFGIRIREIVTPREILERLR